MCLAVRRGTVAVTTLLALMALASGVASARTAAARTVTPQRWVRQVCGSLNGWLTDSGEVDYAASDAADALATGKQQPAKARAAMVKQYAKGIALTETLTKHIKAVGTPSIDGGARIVSNFMHTLTDLRAVYADARAAAARLPLKGNDLGTKAIAIDERVGDGFSVVGDPLEELQAVPAIATVIADDPTCSEVEDYYHSYEPLDIVIGDCLTRNTETVPCAAAHEGEVVFVGAYAGDPGSAYPGDAAIESYVNENCLPAFADYVGVDLDSSKYDLGWIQPDSSTWGDNDRQVICYVTSTDGTLLTDSVRGSVA